jgi:diacylglycerol kinase
MINLYKLVKSFGHAFRGVKDLLQTEQNAKIHLSATLLVFVFSIGFHISRVEASILFVAVIMVFALEIINTAIEKTLDLLHPHEHDTVRRVKDALAGSVLIAAFIALVVATAIFYPYVWALVGRL